MDHTTEFYCVVKSGNGDDVLLAGKRKEWATLRWTDEFGNSIAPFFTTRESARLFLKEMGGGWQLKCYPASFVVDVILADIKRVTSFYTIDPISTERFETLSLIEFLKVVFFQRPVEGTPEVAAQYQDIVPIEELFGEGHGPVAQVANRRLLAAADLIFGVDVISGEQSLVFGRLSLEELIRTGHSKILGVMNIGLDQQSMEMEKLATLVQDIKGHHDYHDATAR